METVCQMMADCIKAMASRDAYTEGELNGILGECEPAAGAARVSLLELGGSAGQGEVRPW